MIYESSLNSISEIHMQLNQKIAVMLILLMDARHKCFIPFNMLRIRKKSAYSNLRKCKGLSPNFFKEFEI